MSDPDYQQGQAPSKTPEEQSVEGSRMTFFEHLGELSKRLKKSLLAFIVAFVVVSSIPDPFHPFGGPTALFGYNFLLISLLHLAEITYAPNAKFLATSLTDPITVFINISLVVALVISLPFIFNQVYGFVAPGLYQRERKAVSKYIIPFTVLFTIGSLFGLLVVFPIVMKILLSFFPSFGLVNLVSLSNFVNLLLLIPVLTGLAFTFPVFLVPLVELKILSAKQLSGARKWVYIVIPLIVGLVNPDPTFISSIPIIIPILILFEVTIFIAKRIENKRNKVQAIQKS
ncbi:MAG: twin-arginine translocase subunit TatC [Nitrososphaerales archaeon]